MLVHLGIIVLGSCELTKVGLGHNDSVRRPIEKDQPDDGGHNTAVEVIISMLVYVKIMG